MKHIKTFEQFVNANKINVKMHIDFFITVFCFKLCLTYENTNYTRSQKFVYKIKAFANLLNIPFMRNIN